MWKMMQKVMASFRKHLFSHTGICIYIYAYMKYMYVQYVYSMYTVCMPMGIFPQL